LQIHGRDLYIAMAGPHQIWKMPLDESEIGPYAGNSREDIVDGPLLPSQPYEVGYASFAQPSGLTADDDWLYVADSEGSSIRAVPFDPSKPVRTIVGTADLSAGRLFVFGDHDGVGRAVRLQHPLGVALVDGLLYVADTYNNKIKAIDPQKKTVHTIAGTGKPGRTDAPAAFDEPAGLSGAAGKLYVADTNNHLIRVIDLAGGNRVSTFQIPDLMPPKLAAAPVQNPRNDQSHGQEIRIDKTLLQPQDGLVRLAVKLALPAGYKINPQGPMRYKVAATNESGPLDRAYLGRSIKVDPPANEFQIELPVAKETGDETISVEVDYYYCQQGKGGICKAGRVTWVVPLSLAGSASRATLPLRLEVE
jgi:NHL repeat